MKRHLSKYANAKVHWLQEEPENQAYWTYVCDRFNTVV